MKWRTVSIAQLVLALVTVAVAGTGCVGVICCKVVDGETDQPLAGVSATWHEHAYNLLTSQLHETGPTNLPATREDGIISIRGVHKNWANSIIFSRPGYISMYGNYSGAKLWLTKRVRPLPNGGFVLEPPVTEAESSNGCLLVKLPR